MKSKLAEQLAADFWEEVGYEEPFPRSLERAIMSTMPVFVVKVHRCRLDTCQVRAWLEKRAVYLPSTWKERRLNGCLVAYRGEAAIFVDGTLSAEDMRVIIAHEFGHYLAEYDRPRSRALRRIGHSVFAVLDGDRAPTGNEQIAATLAGVELGVFVHYMDRSADSGRQVLVQQVETTADILGAELLAPSHAVTAEIRRDGSLPTKPDRWTEVLESHFGLPHHYAEPYAKRLAGQARRNRTFAEVLGLG
jgi:hypothetical protein